MTHVARTLGTLGTIGLMAAGGAVSSHAAPAAAPGTTTAAATAVHTSTARRLPATKGVVLRITDSRGRLLRGWSVENRHEALECRGPSFVAISKDTHDCGGTATSSFACVPEAGRKTILCINDPWSHHLLRYRVAGKLPVTPRPSWVAPLGVKLADGSRWYVRNGGAWSPGPNDMRPIYGCEHGCGLHEALLTGPGGRGPWVIKQGATWYMRRGPLGYDLPKGAHAVNQRLDTVWYLTR